MWGKEAKVDIQNLKEVRKKKVAQGSFMPNRDAACSRLRLPQHQFYIPQNQVIGQILIILTKIEALRNTKSACRETESRKKKNFPPQGKQKE